MIYWKYKGNKKNKAGNQKKQTAQNTKQITGSNAGSPV